MMKIPFNAKHARLKIVRWIRKYCVKAGIENGVVGMSGGLDSSVTACLAAEALGPEHVWGMILPYKFTPQADVKDAVELANRLGIHWAKIDIAPIVDAFAKTLGRLEMLDKLSLGNIIGRVRMTILYQRARVHNAIVIGTTNRTELLCGYFTKWGDGGIDIIPLGGVYKTQVRKLAKELGIPERIVEKVPSAHLWLEQTDEGELSEKIGFPITYEILDAILFLLYEKGLETKEVAGRLKLQVQLVHNFVKLIKKNEHKRLPIPVCRI